MIRFENRVRGNLIGTPGNAAVRHELGELVFFLAVICRSDSHAFWFDEAVLSEVMATGDQPIQDSGSLFVREDFIEVVDRIGNRAKIDSKRDQLDTTPDPLVIAGNLRLVVRREKEGVRAPEGPEILMNTSRGDCRVARQLFDPCLQKACILLRLRYWNESLPIKKRFLRGMGILEPEEECLVRESTVVAEDPEQCIPNETFAVEPRAVTDR